MVVVEKVCGTNSGGRRKLYHMDQIDNIYILQEGRQAYSFRFYANNICKIFFKFFSYGSFDPHAINGSSVTGHQ